MNYICKVCQKEMKRFDNLIKRCYLNKNHRSTIVLKSTEDEVSLETIYLYLNDDCSGKYDAESHYCIEFHYDKNITVFLKATTSIYSEVDMPFYHENKIIDVDFSDIPALIKRLELMETFS